MFPLQTLTMGAQSTTDLVLCCCALCREQWESWWWAMQTQKCLFAIAGTHPLPQSMCWCSPVHRVQIFSVLSEYLWFLTVLNRRVVCKQFQDQFQRSSKFKSCELPLVFVCGYVCFQQLYCEGPRVSSLLSETAVFLKGNNQHPLRLLNPVFPNYGCSKFCWTCQAFSYLLGCRKISWTSVCELTENINGSIPFH